MGIIHVMMQLCGAGRGPLSPCLRSAAKTAVLAMHASAGCKMGHMLGEDAQLRAGCVLLLLCCLLHTLCKRQITLPACF